MLKMYLKSAIKKVAKKTGRDAANVIVAIRYNNKKIMPYCVQADTNSYLFETKEKEQKKDATWSVLTLIPVLSSFSDNQKSEFIENWIKKSGVSEEEIQKGLDIIFSTALMKENYFVVKNDNGYKQYKMAKLF